MESPEPRERSHIDVEVTRHRAGPFEVTRTEFSARGIQSLHRTIHSLCWDGGGLVDWVEGGNRYVLNGDVTSPWIGYGYLFDSAVQSPSGRYAVIYDRRGTKGLILERGLPVREINRSYYEANTYEYPVALLSMQDGSELLIHCPDKYNVLEVEETSTGERLTRAVGRDPIDLFHSRLSPSRSCTRILSAGWYWHPWDTMLVADVAAAIGNPVLLGSWDNVPVWDVEVSSATFIDDDRVVFSTSGETDKYDEEAVDAEDSGCIRVRPNSIAVMDAVTHKALSSAPTGETLGTMMPLGPEYVISFYGHPKLVHVPTGEVLCRWEDVPSGKQDSSIIHQIDRVPPMALDPKNNRFAIASEERLIVFSFEQAKSG